MPSLTQLLAATAALGAAALSAAASVPPASSSGQLLQRRQATCEADSGMCFAEATGSGIRYRVGLPNVDAAPFDVLLQVVAPRSVGWAGLAWGGQMTYNPLTVGWANGDTDVVVSSRWATGHQMPGPYAGASYEVLGPSGANATHWTLSVLCRGCSQWTDAVGVAKALDPASAQAPLAYAFSRDPPRVPASNASAISYHAAHGQLALDLAGARSDAFDAYVAALRGGYGV